MGVVATRAIEARRRSTGARIDRLITERDAKDPSQVARSRRIKAAARDARKALRARTAAARAGETAEVRADVAVRRLLDEGLSLSDAAVLLDLSTSAAKRLGRLPAGATDPVAAESFTEPTIDWPPADPDAHREERHRHEQWCHD